MSVVCPPELVFDDEIFDLAMNPTAPIVATAMITGELAVCVIKRNHFLWCVFLFSSSLPHVLNFVFLNIWWCARVQSDFDMVLQEIRQSFGSMVTRRPAVRASFRMMAMHCFLSRPTRRYSASTWPLERQWQSWPMRTSKSYTATETRAVPYFKLRCITVFCFKKKGIQKQKEWEHIKGAHQLQHRHTHAV